MRRFAVLLAVVLALGAAPAVVSANGLFSLPGLPSFGGMGCGPMSCGDKAGTLMNVPTFYVGWQFMKNAGTQFSINAQNAGVGGVLGIEHKYNTDGLWIGLSDMMSLSDNLGIIVSGWYLFPTNGKSGEVYNNVGLGSRSWTTKTEWWFVDALAAIGAGGASFLAGVRYDYYSTRFSDPQVVGFFALPSLVTDEADVKSNGYIPLLGFQYAAMGPSSSMVVRVVGIPTLAGSAKYNQTVGGALRVEGTGTWSSGYFVEFWGEYSRKFGDAETGVFVRYNVTNGNSDVNVDLLPGTASDTFKLGFNRQAVTLGGRFAVNFNLPF